MWFMNTTLTDTLNVKVVCSVYFIVECSNSVYVDREYLISVTFSVHRLQYKT